MDEQTKEILRLLIQLQNNPMSDVNSINPILKKLEWVDTANWSPQDWKLYKQAVNR